MCAARRRVGPGVLLAALAALVPAAAQAQPAPALSLSAQDADGQPTAGAVAGEHWNVGGSLSPYAAGDVVTVTVERAGAVVASRAVPVQPQPLDGGASGFFRLPMRVRRPGALLIRAGRAPSAAGPQLDAPPVGVTVRSEGSPRRGCRGPAEIVRAAQTAPALLGDGARARHGMLLDPDAVAAVPETGRLRLVRAGATYVVRGGRVVVGCRDLELPRGHLQLQTPPRRHFAARLALGGAAVWGLRPGTRLSAATADGAAASADAAGATGAQLTVAAGGARVASARFPRSRLQARRGDVVLIGSHGLPRLRTWPFARDPHDHRARGAPPFWADGLACSVGCRPPGARRGWPLRPFHAQHALRSGLNELRTANLHVGVDIQARDGSRVYAVQSGRAHLAGTGTVDARVRVGAYLYWHVVAHVREGQYVRAHRTVVGVVLKGAGHLHFSELRGADYLNPLRPGGRVLAPYRDSERPVVGAVRWSGATAVVDAFDPQSFQVTTRYRTPVLAPAAVAWRTPGGPLEFAYRGSQHLPDAFRFIYGPGTHAPDDLDPAPAGWACFWSHVYCIPRWEYRLPGLPAGARAVTVYAWDWAGNVSARSSRLVRSPYVPAAQVQ